VDCQVRPAAGRDDTRDSQRSECPKIHCHGAPLERIGSARAVPGTQIGELVEVSSKQYLTGTGPNVVVTRGGNCPLKGAADPPRPRMIECARVLVESRRRLPRRWRGRRWLLTSRAALRADQRRDQILARSVCVAGPEELSSIEAQSDARQRLEGAGVRLDEIRRSEPAFQGVSRAIGFDDGNGFRSGSATAAG
jgi:hypothetical protein